MKSIKDILFTIFHSSYWIMLYPYSKEWDDQLNMLMECNTFKRKNEFIADLGNQEIWIKNYPYACFRPINPGCLRPEVIRPSRGTIYKAWKKLRKDIKEKNKNGK